ncbi:Alpha/Beta hydrolase protein [Pseudomassariella vexata]|uniref:Carboxypeptidase n=1 Tax=Pseudomassariella vexata TaxID=1141098 RepID=A0A1Y2EE54_9PEZI|nr:Alpha/Beta hydrolase protein [Pseudomassariella vexata]ORY69594.1 Alpha/Beta hydrolase protein [Pseudomassariella vexata]
MAFLLRHPLVLALSILAATTTSVLAIPTAGDRRTVESPLDSKVSLSYKETKICETTQGVKSYSGYVNLPADPAEGRNYDIHTFFWFFEARHDPSNAPLSLWLQGGPGVPSITAAVGENGPCRITSDSKDTVLNEWSWNNEVNMLYIDQPVQVGFSYDKLTNGTIDEVYSPVFVTPQEEPLDSLDLNSTWLGGTFPSQSPNSTANTTTTAARAAWHFMQTWMQEFPKYKPNDNKFSIWAESYGGHYGPTFADFFESQNSLVASGDLHNPAAVPLHLDTLGLVNSCVDILTQMPTYPITAYNNTYDIQIINETVYQAAVDSFPTCSDLVKACRSLSASNDPLKTGADPETNDACSDAYEYCFRAMWQPYSDTGRNPFDLTSMVPSPFPPKYAAGYLNTKEIQEELGVPLNFTGQSVVVNTMFADTGDFILGDNLAILGQLLDRGVKIALMYGDRDYQCNWLGGERISLAIESSISANFGSAGYANIQTNDSYIGGLVRQYGNLSFSRVFSAGHEVPYYQPETAYKIFSRVMSEKDVATGSVSTNCEETYSTIGPADISGIKNDLPDPHKPECYFWDIQETCTPEQAQIFGSGRAITENFILIGYVAQNGSAVYY